MFTVKKQILSPETTKYWLLENGKILSYHSWINLLKTSTDFTDFFTEILKTSGHSAFFWEVKPTNQNNVNENFEFVLVKSNSLPRITADEHTFQKYFTKEEKVVSFSNLGGDADLVVPTPLSAPDHYAHLATFVRNAPAEQISAFWNKTATIYGQKIGKETIWLSTAGLGVSWLHVRIDIRPKYYRFQDYK